MASVTGIINVKVNTAGAAASLAGLAKSMQAQNAAMLKGSAAVSAGQLAAARAMQSRLNQSGKWVATTGSMMTATGRMAEQFDKGTHKSFSNFRRGMSLANRDMMANTAINRLAQQRVRALQTQYMALGREVDGVQKVMKMQPSSMLTDNFGRSADYANQRAVLFRRNLTMGANSMINWGKNTQWAGRQMMVGLGIPLGIAAVGAVRSFKDIEQASISFRRVYGDSVKDTAQANSVLKTVMSDVGQEYTKYGVAMSDTISVAARAAATGQKGAALVGTTRETLRLATLGQLDYDQALESTIATQTAFGVSTQGLTRVTDFLNAAENQTILSMSDMTKAIPRVAPVIKGLGGDVEDLGVLMTALRAGGVTAEQGANALKSGLASLINPTSSATEAMKSFGIPLDKIVNANKGDLIGTVQDFGKALQELPKFEQQQALESLFGKYQYARMGALFRNINERQAKTTAQLSESSNSKLASFSSQEMDQIADSALNKFQGAVERLKAAAAPLGEAILTGLAPIIDFGANALNFLNENSWAAWAAAGTAALVGLAGVGTMLTGVFANFFGTMIKGGQMMHRAGARLIGKPLTPYVPIADLEAAAAQKSLSAAANAASASFMKEAQAVSVLVAELQRMNAAAAQSVATTTAATKRPPGTGGATAVVPPTPPPSTPPAGAVVRPAPVSPAVVPGSAKSQYASTYFARAHVGGMVPVTAAELKALSEQTHRGKATQAAQWAMSYLPGGKNAGKQAMGLGGRTMMLPTWLNNQLSNAEHGGATFAPKTAWMRGMSESGPFAMEHLFRMMGIDTKSAEAAKAAQQVHASVASQISRSTMANLGEHDVGRFLDTAIRQTFANDPKLLAAYDKTGRLNTVDTTGVVANGGRRGVSGLGSDYLPAYNDRRAFGNIDDLFTGGLADVEMSSEAAAALSGAAANLDGSASALKGAASSLAAAGRDAGGKPNASGTTQRAGYTTSTTPYRGVNVPTPNADRIAARMEADRASQYSRGYFAQQKALEEKSQRAATAQRASLWNRMRAGGVFGGGTRGMTPEEKASAKMNRSGGVSNAMMGLGMIAETGVLMASMSGKEIPAFAHAIGPAAMALGMFPGAITPVVSLLSNPVTGALAAIAAVAGAGVVAWKFMNNKAAEAGEAAGNYAVASNKTIDALGAQYGNTTLAQQVAERRAAKAADASVADVQKSKEAVQSEVGQQITQGYADAISKTGSIQSAQDSMVNNLASAVFQKAMSVGQARAFANESLGDVQGAQVSNQLNSMIGKRGQLLAQDPTGFAVDSLLRNQTTALEASKDAVASQSDFWKTYNELEDQSSMFDYGTAFDSNAGDSWFEWGRVGDLFGGLANTTSGAMNKVSGGLIPKLSGLQAAGDATTASTEANAYAATVWSNALQSGYATRTAAEERLRLMVQARDKAQKDMAAAEKSNPDSYRQDKTWQAAAQQVKDYNKAITQGNQGLKQFDNTYGNMSKLSNEAFSGLANGDDLTKQNQYLESQRTALGALYSQNPAMAAAQIMEQQSMQMKAESVGKTPQEINDLMYAYQTASLTGLTPGSMGALDALTGQKGLESLPGLMDITSGGMLGEVLATAQGFKGDKNILGEALLSAKTGQEFTNLRDKLGEFTKLAPNAQKALDNAFGDSSAKQIKQWGNQLDSGRKTLKQVTDDAYGGGKPRPEPKNIGYKPGQSNRSYSTSGDRGAPKPTPTPPPSNDPTPGRNAPLADAFSNWWNNITGGTQAHAATRTSIPGVPQSIAKPGYKGPTLTPTSMTGQGRGAGVDMGSMIKPDIGAATAAGKAEGQARGQAMTSTVLQKAKASGQPMQAVARQSGTQQGKIQGTAMNTAISTAVGKAGRQSGKTLGSMIGKGTKAGSIKLKVDDGGATGKINKVKSAMSKLKSGKGGDIKLKATDNASPKIQKVSNKAKQLKSARAEVKLRAQDNASQKIQKVKAKAASLKAAKANVLMRATDNASPKIAQVKEKAAALKASDINVPLQATDNASPTINTVKSGLTAVGAMHPNPPISASDNASGTISSVSSALSSLNGQSATVHINVEKNGSVGGSVADYLAKGGSPISRGVFTGRRVSGPGGPEEDKVPAWLSPGEFVMRQKAVKKYGTSFMHDVNAMRLNKGGDGGEDPGKKGKGNKKDSKGKGSGDSGDKGDKDTGWKDLTKEIKKLSKVFHLFHKNVGKGQPFPQIGKAGKKRDVSAEMMSELLATGSPNAVKQFFGKKKESLRIQKKLQDKIRVETLQGYYDQTAADKKALKASAYRSKILKKIKGNDDRAGILKMSDEELLGMQQLNLGGKNGGNKFIRQSAQRKDRLENRQEKFDLRGAYFERLDSFTKTKDYNNRFSNAKLAGAGINQETLSNMSQEDFDIAMSLSTTELKKFVTELKKATEAERKAAIVAENAALSQAEKGNKVSEALSTYAQTFKDQAEARANRQISEKFGGKTRAQVEAEMSQDQVAVDRASFVQTVEQQKIDDINKSYDEQQKLLDKISASQQIISQLQKGRLNVASALSSGDIAAAAAAAQEQRAAEAQANLDMMKQSLQDEQDAKVKEHQDIIDAQQDVIDGLNNKMTMMQLTISQIDADAATAGAAFAAPYEKSLMNLEKQDEYWSNIRKEIYESLAGIEQIAGLNVADLFGQPRPTGGGGGGGNGDDEAPHEDPWKNSTKKSKKAYLDAAKQDGNYHDQVSNARRRMANLGPKKQRAAEKKLNKINNSKLSNKGDRVEQRLLNAAMSGDTKKAEKLSEKAQKIDNKLENKLYNAGLLIEKKDKDLVKPKDYGNDNKKKDDDKKKKDDDNKKGGKGKKGKNHAFGGFVGGMGNTDKVPAMLTPGEFVMTKGAAARYGKALEKVNSPSFRFADKAGMIGGTGGGAEGNVYNVTINANGVADAEEIATITLNKIKSLDSMRVREMRKF